MKGDDDDGLQQDSLDSSSSVSGGSANDDLDEEDLELIRESHQSRPAPHFAKARRTKRVIEDSDDDGEGGGGEGGGEEASVPKHTEKEGSRPLAYGKRHRSLEDIFSDEDDEKFDSRPRDEETSEDEGLDDFIEEEEEEEEEEEGEDALRPPTRPASKRSKETRPTAPSMALWGAQRSISKDAWDDLMDIFGDGSEYADLVWEDAGEEEEEEGDAAVAKVAGPADTTDGLFTDLATFAGHPLFFGQEAQWMQREFKKKYATDIDAAAIESVLALLVSERLSVPFIAAFRKDQCGGIKLFHLWAIHDWNQHWVANKLTAMACQCQSIDNAELVSEWCRKLACAPGGPHHGLAVAQFVANLKTWAPIHPPTVIPESVNHHSGDYDRILQQILRSDATDLLVKKIEAGIVLTTRPSEAGKKTSLRDEAAHVISVVDKPVASCEPAFWATLHWAIRNRQCGTPEYRFKDRDSLVDQVRQLYSADAQGEHVVELLVDGLIARVIKRLPYKLAKESVSFIAQSCGFELQQRLHHAMTCAQHRPPSSPFCVVSLGVQQGASAEGLPPPSSVLGAVKMTGKAISGYAKFAYNSDEEWSKLVAYIGNSAVVVSGCSHHCLAVHNRLSSAGLECTFACDDVARVQPKRLDHLFLSSLQGVHPVIRYCATVGLRLASPLDVFGCLADDELTKLELHPLRHLVLAEDSDELLGALKRAISNCVHQWGIDADQTWLYEYILSRDARPKKAIDSRQQMENAASGFVRFPESECVLDRLRICLDDYPLVERMLRDACADEEPTGTLDDLVKLVQSKPGGLLELDLNDFNKHIGGGRLVMLETYRRLLLLGPEGRGDDVKDVLSAEQIFWMVSGEREFALQPGKMVRVRLPPSTSAGYSSVIATLEGSGLPVKCMLDSSSKRSGSQNAVVLSINLHDWSIDQPVHQVVRVSVHRDDCSEPKQPVHADSYYRKPETAVASARPAEQSKDGRPVVPPAVLHHPAYRGNMPKEAIEGVLAKCVAGEAVVRAAANAMYVSWRVCSKYALCAHFPLFFDGSSYTLNGVKSRRYEDLDEVIARGIEPNARLLDDIVNCPKHIDLAPSTDRLYSQQVESLLQEQLSRAPGRVAYGLWLSRDSPGTAFLSIAPRHHEPVQIDEGEYVFRRQRFRSLASLIEFLKRQK